MFITSDGGTIISSGTLTFSVGGDKTTPRIDSDNPMNRIYGPITWIQSGTLAGASNLLVSGSSAKLILASRSGNTYTGKLNAATGGQIIITSASQLGATPGVYTSDKINLFNSGRLVASASMTINQNIGLNVGSGEAIYTLTNTGPGTSFSIAAAAPNISGPSWRTTTGSIYVNGVQGPTIKIPVPAGTAYTNFTVPVGETTHIRFSNLGPDTYAFNYLYFSLFNGSNGTGEMFDQIRADSLVVNTNYSLRPGKSYDRGLGGVLDIAPGSTVTYPGLFVGEGSMFKDGPGTLIVSSSNNSHKGNTQVTDGTLTAAKWNTFASGSMILKSGSNLRASDIASATILNVSSSLIVTGATITIG